VTLLPTKDAVRFGPFELDQTAWQLRKDGIRIRIPPQPLQLLAILVEHPGVVFTREELRARLWPSEVFVDFDHGLNKNIQKLREALGDSAESPRFLETIPRVGYRFIGVLSHSASPSLQDLQAATAEAALAIPPKRAIQRSMWRRPLPWAVLAGAAGLALAVWLVQRRAQGSPIRSLAVLPLENLSNDPNQEYFAEGMTDELITMLAKESTLRVTSRTSTMQYKGAHRPLREIAQELGVDAILEGTITRTGDQVHMNVQLIQASNDAHIWAESYDRRPSEMASLPSEAAHAIASKLNSVTPQIAVARYVSTEAHDAYLHGRYLMFSLNNSERADTYEQAGKYFEKAIELQPDYADAWTGLADFYNGEAFGGLADPRDALEKGMAAARKAVQLDDASAAAHVALGSAYLLHDWNWALAQKEVDRALELDPRFAPAYSLRSDVLGVLNRDAEAVEAGKKSVEFDASDRSSRLPWTYIGARKFDQALTATQDRLAANPNDPDLHFALSWILLHYGRYKEGTEEKARGYALSGDDETANGFRRAYSKGGYQATLIWRFEQNKKDALTGYSPPADQAIVAARLGRGDDAIAYLELAYQEHSPELLELQHVEPFDFLHADSRYRSIVQRVGLPPAY
jgi:TolB-like protein/DNA-binding winged helix-turn-helix (wHTH) protein